MDRNGFVAAVLLVLVFPYVSGASIIVRFRNLVAGAPEDNFSTIKISPVASPASSLKKIDPLPRDADKFGKDSSKNDQVSNNSTNFKPEASNNRSSLSPPAGKQENRENHQEKENGGKKWNGKAGADDTCDGSRIRCIKERMTACVKGYESREGSIELSLLVQNEGEKTLKVNISVPSSLKAASKEHEVLAGRSERINISSVDERAKVILNAGKGDCVLYVEPSAPEGTFFQKLPFSFYTQQVTPIYGAYLFFLIALMIGGSWACCKYRKRSQMGAVPYQELEMGLPESSRVNVETAEGWEQDWDDDWDGEKSVKSLGGHHVGAISRGGLTSRSSNRDGWEKDWND